MPSRRAGLDPLAVVPPAWNCQVGTVGFSSVSAQLEALAHVGGDLWVGILST